MSKGSVILPVILLIGFVIFARAAADIAPNPMTGGRAIAPYEERPTDVRMVEENVDVRIFTDRIATTASFSMHNEGETVNMQVGFPLVYPRDLIEFHAFVNGRPVAVRDGRKEHVYGQKKVTAYWKLWDMIFHRDERCTITVEYETKPMSSPGLRCEREAHASLPNDVRESVRRASTKNTVEYYLSTGKQWKGVLDRCRITFKLVGLSNAYIKEYWPKDGVVTENHIVWEYTDYEPSGFVVLNYYPHIPTRDIPPFLRGVAERYPNDPELVSDIGSFFGSFGRGDLQREVYHAFLAGWDEPIPQLMEYASGGRCRFNYQAGNQFYTVWRMALILFDECRGAGELETQRDIAPTVSRITGAIVDSLDTCNLPERDAPLQRKAKELLDMSNGLIEASGRP
jgi:hypothetical protein